MNLEELMLFYVLDNGMTDEGIRIVVHALRDFPQLERFNFSSECSFFSLATNPFLALDSK